MFTKTIILILTFDAFINVTFLLHLTKVKAFFSRKKMTVLLLNVSICKQIIMSISLMLIRISEPKSLNKYFKIIIMNLLIYNVCQTSKLIVRISQTMKWSASLIHSHSNTSQCLTQPASYARARQLRMHKKL